jgi:hypothetical protein
VEEAVRQGQGSSARIAGLHQEFDDRNRFRLICLAPVLQLFQLSATASSRAELVEENSVLSMRRSGSGIIAKNPAAR